MPSQALARYQVEIGDGFPLFQAIINQGKNDLPLPKQMGVNEVTSEALIEKLRTYYTAICTDLPLPMSEATFPLKKLFTQLVILENKLVEQKEKETEKQGKEKHENFSHDPSLPERDSLAEVMAHLQETSTTPIAMGDLFAKKESAKEPKKVLLIGRAGIGKTTLIDRITLGWTEGEMFPQFEAVFRLVLRELNDFQEQSQNLHWLAAAISHAIYKDRDQFHDVLAYIQQHQNRILILLDGLDEASPTLILKIDQLLQMDLHILISSRPGVPAAIKKSHR